MPLLDIFNFTLRDFLGIPRQDNNDFDQNRQDYTDQSRYYHNGDDDPFEPGNSQDRDDGFDIFNESLDMHRHFEQQINEVMKIFGMNMFGIPFSQFRNDEDYEDQYEIRPAIEHSLREQYLKPGYQAESSCQSKVTDSDLDGVIAPNDLNEFISRDQRLNKVPEQPRHNSPFQGGSSFFGRMVITHTTTKSDGTVETRRTVRDSRTNEEETTITVIQKDGNDVELAPKNIPNDETNLWKRFFKF